MMWDGRIPDGKESRALVPADNPGHGKVASEQEYHLWARKRPWRREKTLPLVAAREGRDDILRHIRICRANENTDYNCHKALITSVCEDNTKALETLYNAGVDFNNTKHKHCAVPIAAEYCNHDALLFLLKHGANPDQRSRNGFTALMWGAFYNDTATIRLLCNAGANPLLRDKEGKYGRTAFKIAYEENSADASHWLISYTGSWKYKNNMQPRLPAPEKKAPQIEAPKPACPEGWSIVNESGAEMAIQTVSDALSKTEIRNVFDFKGKRLLTEFRSAGGPPSLSDRRFDEIETALVDEARNIFDAAAKKNPPPAEPGLI